MKKTYKRKRMAREKTDYRPMLEQLNLRFPDKEFLKPDEVAAFIGCSRRTVDRKFKDSYIKGIGLAKCTLARLLCT